VPVATPAATSAAVLAGPTFVYRQRAAFQFILAEFFDGFVRIFVAAHFDESKSPVATGFPIR
jgi:hypothetical protein